MHSSANQSVTPLRAGAAVILSAILLAPLLVVDVPPLTDYPNHLARMVLLAGQAPELAPFYQVNWAILPNLAMDLIVAPLLAVLPLHVAGRLLLALTLLLPLAGVLAYSRTAFGGWSWWPFAAALIAYNGVFLLGFVNFSLGLGVALLGAALWMRLSEARPGWAMPGLCAVAFIAFFCHLLAAAFLFLLVGSHELGRLAARRREAAAWRGFALRACLIGIVALAVALLFLQAPLSRHVAAAAEWGSLEMRLRNLGMPFATYAQPLDLLVALAVMLFLLVCLALGRLRIHPGSAIAGGVCLIAFFAVPTASASGALIELRPGLLLGWLLFAGVQPEVPRRARLAAIGVFGLLLLARTAVLGSVWQGFAQDLAEIRATIAPVEPGRRVMTVVVEREANAAYFNDQQARRILSFSHWRSDSHLGALLVTERHALWPSLFAIEGQQPLRALEPLRGFTSLTRHALPDRAILTIPAASLPPALAVWSDWPARFDYVLLLHARAAPGDLALAPDRLTAVTETGMAALFRVKRP